MRMMFIPVRRLVSCLMAGIALWFLSLTGGGCAQIGAPTGGPRDSLAPVLQKASPEMGKLNFSGNRITLTFDEYVEVADLQQQFLMSPTPKTNPTVSGNLRTISIKLRDSLLPNTTYTLQFGNAIKDINEGNILTDFTYVFSTGDYIDSLSLNGSVKMAETGGTDSTLMVLLYRDAPDSAVQTRKPDYSTRVKGDGSFRFKNLPGAEFKVYALKDADGGRTYNSKTEIFAFADETVDTRSGKGSVNLLAYAAEKAPAKPGSSLKAQPEKKLRYSSNQANRLQDLLTDLRLDFNNPLQNIDSTQIILADTNYNRLPGTLLTVDSTRKKITFTVNWSPDRDYVLLLGSGAFTDSAGNQLPKADTMKFKTRRVEDYGRVALRFSNLDLEKKPVIQFLIGDEIKLSAPLTSNQWANSRFLPGEYDMRILYDRNGNGRWDPGDYSQRLQPETVVTLSQKLAIRADWDNERDISL